MSIKVTNDANNGTVTIKGAEVAGDYTVTTPAFATELAPRMVLMTAQNSTSGTSIDFTGIPAWAKKITVMFAGVSTSGTSPYIVQLGDSGGIENTTYVGWNWNQNGTESLTPSTGICLFLNPTAASTHTGTCNINNLNGNTWQSTGIAIGTVGYSSTGAGSKTLPGTLDRIRITTVNGTDTFDAGQINVLYEG